VKAGESVFGYLERTRGGFDLPLYRQLIGAANEYKEGDEAAGLATSDATSRANARLLLRNTRISELRAHPLFEDGCPTACCPISTSRPRWRDWNPAPPPCGSRASAAPRAKDRMDYILHPPSGEQLSKSSLASLRALRDAQAGRYDVQLVISDGLNAWALTDEGHLAPYLERVRTELTGAGYKVAPQPIVVTWGRVRAGYHIGEVLYGSLPDKRSHRAILHIVGERPGSGHHAYSVYITAPTVGTWAQEGLVDHNITRVVSDIADTALLPSTAAVATVNLLEQLAPL
jgi:hypothetical protein